METMLTNERLSIITSSVVDGSAWLDMRMSCRTQRSQQLELHARARAPPTVVSQRQTWRPADGKLWWDEQQPCPSHHINDSQREDDESTSTGGLGRRVHTSWPPSTERIETALYVRRVWRVDDSGSSCEARREERQKILHDGEAAADSNSGGDKLFFSVRSWANEAAADCVSINWFD
jgi:hypothetical protein